MSDIIKYYFKLQYARFARRCTELEIPKILIIFLCLIGFYLGSQYLFYKLSWARWLYLVIFISLLSSVNTASEKWQLKAIFNTNELRSISVFSHGFISLPFVSFLAFRAEWLVLGVLILVALCASLLEIKPKFNIKIPTPFYARPFEFISGFRISILVSIIAYFLVFKAIQVNNSNLGYAAMGLLYLLSISFYARPENDFFVWIYNKKASSFLNHKIGFGSLNSLILVFPALVTLSISFPSNTWIGIAIALVGTFMLLLIILAKYAAFPSEINVIQAILIAVSLLFPPLLFYTVPNFYAKAKRQLNFYLQ